MTNEAFIYDAIRTPRGKGKPGGALCEVKPIDLITNLLEEMKSRHDLDTSQVEDVVLATGEPVREQGQNIAKAPLRRLEALGVPVAVGINGAALGGGYEIALACHHRIALNNKSVRKEPPYR